MSYCTNCNRQNPPGTTYCGHCAARLHTGPRPIAPFSANPFLGSPPQPNPALPIPPPIAATVAMGPTIPNHLAIGTIVDGKYAIESQLGEGGMGVVYLARDIYLETLVAIKGIRPDLARNNEFRARILAEGKAMAEIDHENVVRLNSVVVQPDELFLVMQYVDGESLDKTIARYATQQAFMPVDHVLRIFGQILAGVGAAHTNGMIHRDIKPANILVSRVDSRVKVTDFGIAKAEDEALARDWLVSGSVLYMSPEEIQGERNLDRRVDIYALGILLFHMLAGRVPFGGATGLVTAGMHLREPVPAITFIRPDVPDYVRSVIEKACAKSRDLRFGSVADMAAALRAPAGDAIQGASSLYSLPEVGAMQDEVAAAPVRLGGDDDDVDEWVDVEPDPGADVGRTGASVASDSLVESRLSLLDWIPKRHPEAFDWGGQIIFGYPRAPNLCGTTIGGRYKLESPAAHWSRLGDQYQARDLRQITVVLVKTIRKELAVADDFRKHILAVARRMALVNHENVVGVMGVLEEPNGDFIVMEHADPLPSVSNYTIRSDDAVPIPHSFPLFNQILLGVAAAHQAGIVHSTISPEIIRVRSSDSVVKVTDFEIERAIDAYFGSRAEYLTGDEVNHYPFMSPGRLLGAVSDQRVDIYSLGILLYVIHGGRWRIRLSELWGAVGEKRAIRFPSIPILPPGIPPHIRSVIVKACAHDPDLRFASVTEMAAAFRGEIEVSLDGLEAAAPSAPFDDLDILRRILAENLHEDDIHW